jgi:hypothetical protein
MPIYLLAITIGQFKSVDTLYNNDLCITIHYRMEKWPLNMTMDVVTKSLEICENLLQCPYCLDKLDIVVIPALCLGGVCSNTHIFILLLIKPPLTMYIYIDGKLGLYLFK